MVVCLFTCSPLSPSWIGLFDRSNTIDLFYQAMSFFQKLISFKSNKKQRIQQQATEDADERLYTRDEEDFVHIYPSLNAPIDSAGGDEESVDISKWEMAEVLSQRNKVMVTKDNEKTRQDTLERLRRYANRPNTLERATVTGDTRPCMEDSSELEKYDDKRNRAIKISRRRKYF